MSGADTVKLTRDMVGNDARFRYLHKTDIAVVSVNVRFRGKSGHRTFAD